MKQYCRYCGAMSHGDVYYCSIKEQVMSEWQVKRPNKCIDFGYCTLGDVDTGKQYHPREQYHKREQNDSIQCRMEGI